MKMMARSVAKLLLSAVLVSVILIFTLVHFEVSIGTVKEKSNRVHMNMYTMITSTPENEGTPHSMEGMHKLHTQRTRTVKEVCRRNSIWQPDYENIVPSRFGNILVDDKYKFLYCMIPKVACTNWLRVMVILSGKVNTTDPLTLEPSWVHTNSKMGKYIRTLDTYSKEEIIYRLNNYFKFMTVREPFERLLSAYRNKFTVAYNKYFPYRYGRTIIKKHRKKPSSKSLESGRTVTFDEFVRYLLDPKRKDPLNQHWKQYYKLCLPCVVQYDAIGKYQTLPEDTDYILRQIGVDQIVQFPKANRLPGRKKTADVLQQSFANISSENLHKLWEMYSVDFAMFEYPYPDLGRH